MQLTSDADRLICILYKAYLDSRDRGFSKADARCFGSSEKIHEAHFPDWLYEDVDETCRELSRNGLLNCFWADGIAYSVELSDSGICYMENRFKNGIVGLTDFISKFIP